MNWYSVSDKAIVEELARRIKQKRLNLNMTQEELSDKAGLHVQTIKKIEAGSSATVQTLVQLLRAFNDLEFLDKFMPDPGVSPIELLKLKGKKRERASSKKIKKRK
jgi:transcriptional regulator with XRE-family HTH domain